MLTLAWPAIARKSGCGSMLIAAGVNANAITELMGHSTITMTFDRYGHPMPGGRAEAAGQVDAYSPPRCERGQWRNTLFP